MLIMVLKWYHVVEQQQFLTFCFVYGYNVSKKIISQKTASVRDSRWTFLRYLRNTCEILNPPSDTC